MKVCITADMEQDCPPYLAGWRGAEIGAPLLLDLLRQEKIAATLFTTGEFARRFPDVVRQGLADGHELACHGDTHAPFRRMTREQARSELDAATDTLSRFAPVSSFRAPYLDLPERLIDLLPDAGYQLDSSVGRHKAWPARVERHGTLLRVPVSVTSSTLRWPWPARRALFSQLADPVVLFVHPWEFVDLRRERLRLDCRFRTGEAALGCLKEAIVYFRRRGATFSTMADLARSVRRAG